MTRLLPYWLTTVLLTTVLAQPSLAQSVKLPPMPEDFKVPEGNTPFLKGEAIGTQNYVCLPAPAGFAWTFIAPQATLFTNIRFFNTTIQQQIITHFLSPNPEENNLARATWQSSLDTSAVWAKLFIAPLTDSNFVAQGAIPWLLLEKAGTRPGPSGGAFLTQTTFIHRLNTSGGIAPSTGCSEAADVGKTALVPYTADYFFYRKSN